MDQQGVGGEGECGLYPVERIEENITAVGAESWRRESLNTSSPLSSHPKGGRLLTRFKILCQPTLSIPNDTAKITGPLYRKFLEDFPEIS